MPELICFQTKPQIVLQQIQQAVESNVHRGVVLVDAAYGIDGQLRAGLTEIQLQCVLGIQSSMTVWAPGTHPLSAKPWSGQGRPPKLLRRDSHHQPVSVKELALGLASSAWNSITWREGKQMSMKSRFAALRVRPAHQDYRKAKLYREEWWLMEWPRGEAEPTKYWISALPPRTKLKDLVRMAKHRWIIGRDYQELKQELGLGHFEGGGCCGFHHHATLCIAAGQVPDRGEEPFFPLGARRPVGNTRAQTCGQLPTAGPPRQPADGMILARSPRSAEPSQPS